MSDLVAMFLYLTLGVDVVNVARAWEQVAEHWLPWHNVVGSGWLGPRAEKVDINAEYRLSEANRTQGPQERREETKPAKTVTR